MNLPGVRAILCNAFVDGFSSAKIALKNEVFDTEPIWVRMTVRELASEQITLNRPATLTRPGLQKIQRECLITVEVFYPVEGAFDGYEGGTDAGGLLAEDVRRFFENKVFAPAKCRAATVNDAVQDEETAGRWWQQRVTIPFFFIEVV